MDDDTTQTTTVTAKYGAINQPPPSPGAELQHLPDSASLQQGTAVTSSSMPLLGHPAQPKVVTRRNTHQHLSEDSTV